MPFTKGGNQKSRGGGCRDTPSPGVDLISHIPGRAGGKSTLARGISTTTKKEG